MMPGVGSTDAGARASLGNAGPAQAAGAEWRLHARTGLVDGRLEEQCCLDWRGLTFRFEGRGLRVLRLEDEWFDVLDDPAPLVESLQAVRDRPRADLLSFRQGPLDAAPRHGRGFEIESLAALPLTTAEAWLDGLRPRTRTQVRKARRSGVEIRSATFDDAFVAGIARLFNETPVRQGRRFWHHGKDAAAVREQFGRYLHRERLVGAYLGEELVGFVMMGVAPGRYAVLNQILASVEHRDRLVSLALVDRAVQICAEEGLGLLLYSGWGDDTLTDFKRHCGFQRLDLPRYHVPLSWRGAIALRCGLHRSWKTWLPAGGLTRLKAIRAWWHARRGG